jgi:hypothetical protein
MVLTITVCNLDFRLIGENMKSLKLFVLVEILVIFFSAMLGTYRSFSQTPDQKVWYVHDTIDPSLEEVKWREDGVIDEAQPWIADGRWFDMSRRESLVNANDIFVSMYERFNWSLVKETYGPPFATFDEFTQFLTDNPVYWLKEMWEIDTVWYGISANATNFNYSFNEASSEVQLWTWFHITRIPEYFVGSERLSNWLVGFDLTAVSVGNLRIYEFYEDSNLAGTNYNLYFKAPANLLIQRADNFTFTIGVAPAYIGYKFNANQIIDINMPANTEIKDMTPLNLSLTNGNTATFVISKDDPLPVSYTVVSGPQSKDFNQVLWENASVWVLTPGGWAAIASLTVLLYTGFRGRRIWRRSRLYHRMYNSMVTIYDLYSSNIMKFQQEMANVSSSIFKLLIEDRITDEQFEKLLVRRDDLMKRAIGEPPKPPT